MASIGSAPVLETLIGSSVPEGWVATTLRQAVATAIGGAWGEPANTANPPVTMRARVIRGTDFKDWTANPGRNAPVRAIDSAALQKRRLEPGDLVVEVSGGGPDQPVGRSIVVTEAAIAASELPFVCSNFCRRVRLAPGFDPAFVQVALRFLYNRGDFDRFQNQSTNLRNLQFNDFLDGVVIPVPPLEEQRRIVAKVEALLARVNAAHDRLARVPAILKRFRQSVLAAACSGRLTEDWRQGTAQYPETLAVWGGSPGHWPVSTLAAATLRITSGSRDWKRYYSDVGPATFVMAQNVRPLRFDPTPIQRVAPPEDDRDRRRTQVRQDDLLVTIVGANTGDACRVPAPLSDYFVCQSVALIRPTDPAASRFIEFWLNSTEHGQWHFQTCSYGEGRPHLSLADLGATPIAIPPSEERAEIERRVDELFALADTIEHRAATTLRRVDRLTQSILSTAFRGVLV